MDQVFYKNLLITKATAVDCGDITVEWFNDDETVLDSELFGYE